MSLPASYLKYAKRKHGQDHDLYAWRTAGDRNKLRIQAGKKVAVSLIVPLEFFPLDPSGVPFKHPGAMQTPYPDLRHFTVRDYGNRVGVFRILGALTAANIKTTFAISGEIAKRYPPLVQAIRDAGHQIAAHGMSTDHIHYDGLKVAEETKLIKDTLACFETKASGWLSPARTQSSRTLELLAKAGLSYCLDWEMDQVPVRMETKHGPITAIPMSNELSDFTLLHTRRQTEESWLKQITDAVDYLINEYDEYGAQTLAIRLTPYIIGQPFRIWALRALLTQLSSNEDVLMCSVTDLLGSIINGDFT